MHASKRRSRSALLRGASIWPLLLALLALLLLFLSGCCLVRPPCGRAKLPRPERRVTPPYQVVVSQATATTTQATIWPAEAWAAELIAAQEELEALHAAPWWVD